VGDATIEQLKVAGAEEPFERCPESDGGTLKPGQSMESCTLFLVPDDVDVGKVYFLSDNGPGKEPDFVYWATE
jgi:hypothetical protein